jgi:hypothetical protein
MTLFSDEERDAICIDSECKEHGDGSMECRVPRSIEEARELQRDARSASMSFAGAEALEATAIVRRSDGD